MSSELKDSAQDASQKDSQESRSLSADSDKRISDVALLLKLVCALLGVVVIVYVAFFVFPPLSDEDTSSAPQSTATDNASDVGTDTSADTTVTEKVDADMSMKSKDGVMNQKDELKIVDTKEGGGSVLVNGMTVKLHYKGTLENGTVFDSSYDRNQPFEFVLGEGAVILGWEQGLLGMKVGGKRTLIIPPALAYGDAGVPPLIPPSSQLTFEVEVLDAK